MSIEHWVVNLSEVQCLDPRTLKLMKTMANNYMNSFAAIQYEMSVSGAMRWPDGFHKEVQIDLWTLEMI